VGGGTVGLDVGRGGDVLGLEACVLTCCSVAVGVYLLLIH